VSPEEGGEADCFVTRLNEQCPKMWQISHPEDGDRMLWCRLTLRKSRPCRVYLIPTDYIIVIDRFYNLTTKSNLTGRLLYDLKQLFIIG